MTYLRSSLAAAGHVQASLAFTAFFLISQANFPPAFCLPGASPPLFLTFVSAEVGYSRRLRECGLRGGLGSRPVPDPPGASLGRAAAASGAAGSPRAGEPGRSPRRRSPAGAGDARGAQPAARGPSVAVPTRLALGPQRAPAARSARRAAPDGLQQPPRRPPPPARQPPGKSRPSRRPEPCHRGGSSRRPPPRAPARPARPPTPPPDLGLAGCAPRSLTTPSRSGRPWGSWGGVRLSSEVQGKPHFLRRLLEADTGRLDPTA